MATRSELQARIASIARQLVAEEFGEVDDSNAMSWLDAIETQAVEIGDAITTELVRLKVADGPPADESHCPQCGGVGEHRGERERMLAARRGPVSITEPEYFCPCCRKAFFPAGSSNRR